MKYLFALLFIVACTYSYTQDVIILKTGDEQTVKVLEVGTTEIKYRKSDNPDGPVYSILKKDVFMIKYKNGEKDVFGNPSASSSNKGQNDFMDAFEIESKGYCGIVETGTNILVSNNSYYGSLTGSNFPMFSFLLFNGGRVSKNLSIGFETGINIGPKVGFMVPGTFALRANILGKRVSPFLEFNAGFNYLNTGQTYFTYEYNYDANTLVGPAFSLSVGVKIWVVKQVAVSMRAGYDGYYDTDLQGNWHLINGVPVMFGVEF